MKRVAVVLTTCIAIALCDLLHLFWGGTAAGLVVGGVMFAMSMANGGATRPVGFAAPHLMKGIETKPADPNANIACALLASGIGSYAVGGRHFPAPFELFYAVCIALGLLIAIVLTVRAELKLRKGD